MPVEPNSLRLLCKVVVSAEPARSQNTSEAAARSLNAERVTLNVRDRPTGYDCQQIVTKSGARRTKTEQIQKTQIVAILQLAKGFSWLFYQIPNVVHRILAHHYLPGQVVPRHTSGVLKPFRSESRLYSL
jgi:hypothetical protein